MTLSLSLARLNIVVLGRKDLAQPTYHSSTISDIMTFSCPGGLLNERSRPSFSSPLVRGTTNQVSSTRGRVEKASLTEQMNDNLSQSITREYGSDSPHGREGSCQGGEKQRRSFAHRLKHNQWDSMELYKPNDDLSGTRSIVRLCSKVIYWRFFFCSLEITP